MPHLDFLDGGCLQTSNDVIAPTVPFVPVVFDNIVMALVILEGLAIYCVFLFKRVERF